MIARFQKFLPFPVYVRMGDKLEPLEITVDGKPFFVRAPYVCRNKPLNIDERVPLEELKSRLAPVSPTAEPSLTIDGSSAYLANALQIDYRADDFDRFEKANSNIKDEDPPVDQFFAAANEFIGRVRSAFQVSFVKPLLPDDSHWMIEYLTDTFEELPAEPGKFRRRAMVTRSFMGTAINERVWSHVSAMSPRDTRVWEDLLLDASMLLPAIGPSVVMGATAMENLITECLSHLAKQSTISPGLWDWIDDRRGDVRKQPSVEEKFDDLLKAFTGRSLKEEMELWKGFKDLKNARNSFVHEGHPRIDKKKDLSVDEVRKLLALAHRVADWIEQFMPAEARREKINFPVIVTSSVML